MKHPQQQESWVDRFRKEFREEPYKDNEEMYFEFYNGCVEFRKGYQGYDSFMVDIETFISTERQRVLNEVRELVEGMKWGDELDDKYEGERVRRMVHNQALDDLLSALKEIEE